jgi:hypothetical protein
MQLISEPHLGDRLANLILRTENRQILRVDRRANSGEQVETDFLPVGMDVLNHVQKVRERSRIPKRATVRIAVAIDERVSMAMAMAMIGFQTCHLGPAARGQPRAAIPTLRTKFESRVRYPFKRSRV